ncbi:hypothetical protein NA56DRAFT_647209 [Hyaloscypha hepaticicola]|uniref:Heterokaryon incompatibility domain-containing protein n=1 Tax=Hyaloscypha hepaticicola TaxID=2082293 RepID=A0A2J6PZP7_9HELO|nr:hypothetical protein NA56DRAFT_647209 [Hyaloscypha hepaticicola]
MSQYQYRHFDSAKQEIRLLILHPGGGEAMVEVEIVHHSLADCPAYEALSYVWGDPTVTEDIHILAPPPAAQIIWPTETQETIQGPTIEPIVPEHHSGDVAASADDSSHDGSHITYIFKVTTNLKSALQHLRTPTKPRVIWVEAICINQQDDAERGHQVRKMDQIYRNCSQVCIWLGDAEEDSDLAMELINSITESCLAPMRDNPHKEITFDSTFVPVFEQFYKDKKFACHFRALLSLIIRPWFSRLWIVQEVVLSTSKIILCGNHQADWACFFNTFLFLFLHAKEKSMLEASYRTSFEIIFHQLPLTVKERWRRSIGMFLRLGAMAISWYDYSPPIVLREALLELRGRSMTDKRNAVYAILSLTSDITPVDLDINYRLDRLEVFKIATRKMIEQSRCLDILCDACTCMHGEYTFPSWLPRFDDQALPCGCGSFLGSTFTFNSSRKLSDNTSAIKPVYFASQGRTAEAVIFGEDGQLITDGIFVDRILVVMQRSTWTGLPNDETELTVPKEWFSLAYPANSFRKTTHPHETPDGSELDSQNFEVLWRTMMANRDSPTSCEPAASQYGEEAQQWLLEHKQCDLVIPPKEVFARNSHSTFLKFKRRLYDTLQKNTLIAIESGLLGLARGCVAPGDQVCILLGCSVPTILRQVPNIEREEYILIGESYIHGMMDGEAIDKLDKGEYKLQKITLV